MFLINSEAELLKAFRPRDRKTVEPPETTTYPLFVRDYLSWIDPTGVRVYLVFQDPVSKLPLGIAFRRDASVPQGLKGRMCDWCHTSGSAEDIGLLSAEKSSKRIVGIGICRDLRCGQKIEQAADLAGRSSRVPLQQLLERMARFAQQGLGIEAVPTS